MLASCRLQIGRLSACSILLIAGISVVATARADVLELKSGGRVEGRVVQEPKEKGGGYEVELSGGGRLKVAASQVARVTAKKATETEYEKLAHGSPDTVAGHWKIVEWCRANKVTKLAEPHLARIIELEPNHEAARAGLGYRLQNGQWMQRQDLMASRGLVLFEGQWVTPQHVELMQRRNDAKASHADWTKKLDTLRRALSHRRVERSNEALAEIRAISDPDAAEAVVAMLNREDDPDVRRLWISVASQIDHPKTVAALVDLSLVDEDPEVRNECLDLLIKSGRPGLITPYIRALKDRDNEMINRAGAALGEIGDPEAIGPLIDVLVTKHRIKVADGSADQYSVTQGPGGGGSFSFGGGPKYETREARNPAVLSALVALSGGASFDYDQDQWRRWLAAQARQHPIDLRRDL